MTLVPFSTRLSDAASPRDRKVMEALVAGQDEPGMVKLWPGTSAPEGYVELDGTAISRVVYAEVFALISTTYGVGDGSTTFNVPDWSASAPSGGMFIMKV